MGLIYFYWCAPLQHRGFLAALRAGVEYSAAVTITIVTIERRQNKASEKYNKLGLNADTK